MNLPAPVEHPVHKRQQISKKTQREVMTSGNEKGRGGDADEEPECLHEGETILSEHEVCTDVDSGRSRSRKRERLLGAGERTGGKS